jgi:hypothetical protein
MHAGDAPANGDNENPTVPMARQRMRTNEPHRTPNTRPLRSPLVGPTLRLPRLRRHRGIETLHRPRRIPAHLSLPQRLRNPGTSQQQRPQVAIPRLDERRAKQAHRRLRRQPFAALPRLRNPDHGSGKMGVQRAACAGSLPTLSEGMRRYFAAVNRPRGSTGGMSASENRRPILTLLGPSFVLLRLSPTGFLLRLDPRRVFERKHRHLVAIQPFQMSASIRWPPRRLRIAPRPIAKRLR